jgi:hypothetical protein
MISTTGTSIESYLDWAKNEIDKKEYGEVSLKFIICSGQIVKVEKMSLDNDKFELKRKGE